MSFSQSFADELADLMSGAGKFTQKKMFGALGFYQGAEIIGCLFEDGFYLKAKGALADELKAQGSKPFVYSGKSGKTVAMPYWTAPQVCLDDADVMMNWVKKAIASNANEPKLAKPVKKRKSK